jgi:MFS family permease
MKSRFEETQKKRKSLRYSFIDGLFASGMGGFTQDHFTPFLLFLGGTTRDVSILSSVPNIISAIAQLTTSFFIKTLRSRRNTIKLFVLLQTLMLGGIAMTAILNLSEYLFIFFVIFFSSFGALCNPAWSSQMSDIVPERKRGAYFGWRNSVLGSVTVAISMIAGIILNNLTKDKTIYGFALIFSAAFIFRFISWYYLTKMHDPVIKHNLDVTFSLKSFRKKIRKNTFARFAIFVALLMFAVNISGPYFAVLMLRDLHFSYIHYIIVVLSSILANFIMMRRWGRLADSIGNIRVMRFTVPYIAIIPLFWLINRNWIFLIIIQVVAGFAWSGFNLSASNYIYDAVPSENRVRYISYFNVMNSLLASAGALLGGFTVDHLPETLGYKILTLLIVSTVLRIIIISFFYFKINEVRPVRKMNNYELFTCMIGIRPVISNESPNINEL